MELTSRQALELEGREQEHCVASYAVKCLMGVGAIFSIRDRHSGRHSRPLRSGWSATRPVLLLHHAAETRRPQQDLQALATRFVEQVLLALPTSRVSRRPSKRRAKRLVREGARHVDAPNTLKILLPTRV